MTNHMKRNSQKKRNIHRSSLKQKKKVQHGGEHNFIYDEIIGEDAKYGNEYFVEILSKIIQKPDQVYNLLTLNKSITLGQFQNVLKTFFLTPREIGDPKRLTGNYSGWISNRTENMEPVLSKAVDNFKKITQITNISGLQMAILYGRYELIEQLFYYKLPDGEKHNVITPDMYYSFYENITIEAPPPDLTGPMTTSELSMPGTDVANSNALHLVFTCGVNIENTPFIQSNLEIEKLRYLSEMYLIKQLFHQINKNWYKVTSETSETPETPETSQISQISPSIYDNMKNKLLEMLNTLKNKYVQNYTSDSAKANLTNIINKYLNVLTTQGGDPDTNIKKLYIDIVNNKEFTEAITDKTFFENASSKQPTGKASAKQIKDNYENFFKQLKEDYLTIINYEKDNHKPNLTNSEFIKVYENLKQKNDFLPEIEVIKENNDKYVDFVIHKQFMWDGTKSILLPNAKDEIIKLNDTHYKLEYEGSLKTVILPGTNKINDKKISNENIEESKNINIITLSSESTVTVDEEFIITPIEIPEKSASSEIVPDTSGVGSEEA